MILGSISTDNGGDSPLGTSDIWLIKEDNIIHALRSGILLPEDIKIFYGIYFFFGGGSLWIWSRRTVLDRDNEGINQHHTVD